MESELVIGYWGWSAGWNVFVGEGYLDPAADRGRWLIFQVVPAMSVTCISNTVRQLVQGYRKGIGGGGVYTGHSQFCFYENIIKTRRFQDNFQQKSKVQMHIIEDLSSRVNSAIQLLVNCLEFTRINAL